MTTQNKEEKTLLQHLDDLLTSGDYGTYVRDYIDLSADYFLNDEQKKHLEGKVKVYINSQPSEADSKRFRDILPRKRGGRNIGEKAKTPIKKSEDITDPLSSLLDFVVVGKAPFGFMEDK